MSSEARSTDNGKAQGGKRKPYFHRSHRKFQNPKRGAPGILLTCETSREIKCRREGLEILDYYWNRSSSPQSSAATDKKQSLEEELAALKNKKSKEPAFVEFETGCRGTVFLLLNEAFNCTDGISKSSTEIDSSAKEIEASDSDPGTAPLKKKQRLEEDSRGNGIKDDPEAVDEDKNNGLTSWNPLETVESIFKDCVEQGDDSKSIPGSRFVTRIIPMQRTCFVSVEEMKSSVRSILESLLGSLPSKNDATSSKDGQENPPTFAIQSKRRNCGHMTRLEIISAVADQVGETTRELPGQEWKVDLGKPDYTVWVEVCKNLCGMSIVPSKYLATAPNFNIAELRDKQNAGASSS
jgi:tRNA(Ser,Leu) C12 N-acetylase TAN1